MTQQHNESPKIILGVALSAAVGASLLYYLRSARNRPTPILHKIGQAIVEVGEAIEECNIGNCFEKAKQQAPSAEDMTSSVMDWASTGINLWKTLKRGR